MRVDGIGEEGGASGSGGEAQLTGSTWIQNRVRRRRGGKVWFELGVGGVLAGRFFDQVVL